MKPGNPLGHNTSKEIPMTKTAMNTHTIKVELLWFNETEHFQIHKITGANSIPSFYYLGHYLRRSYVGDNISYANVKDLQNHRDYTVELFSELKAVAV